ncbi:MAG: hypothetical protein LBT70_00655 [Holosporaceae bacterium]|nr:hypothetical protein [Holosporaceae bacterium]
MNIKAMLTKVLYVCLGIQCCMCWGTQDPQDAPAAAPIENPAPEEPERILGAPNLATGESEYLYKNENGVFCSLNPSESPPLTALNQNGVAGEANDAPENVPAENVGAQDTTTLPDFDEDFSAFLSD